MAGIVAEVLTNIAYDPERVADVQLVMDGENIGAKAKLCVVESLLL